MNDKNIHLTICLSEEASEVIQAASKILRFGNTAENQRQLIAELNDLAAVVDLLQDNGVLPVDCFLNAHEHVREKQQQVLEHWKEVLQKRD